MEIERWELSTVTEYRPGVLGVFFRHPDGSGGHLSLRDGKFGLGAAGGADYDAPLPSWVPQGAKDALTNAFLHASVRSNVSRIVPGSLRVVEEVTHGSLPVQKGLMLDYPDAGAGPRPTPADEWSKPVKDEEGGWRSETVGAPMGHYHDALLRDGYIGEGMDRQTAIPSHVALRLLAAEASDRLGWVWEVERNDDGKPTASYLMESEWMRWTPDTINIDGDFTPDELLAAMHGRFLLEDALKEGNDVPS